MNSKKTLTSGRLLRVLVIAGSIGLVHFIVNSIATSEGASWFLSLGSPLTWKEQLALVASGVLGLPGILLPEQWREVLSSGVVQGANSLFWGAAGYLLFDFVSRWRDPNRQESNWRFSLMNLVVVTSIAAIILGMGLSARNAAKRDEALRTEWEKRGVLVDIYHGRVVSIYPNSDRDLTRLVDCPEVSQLAVIEDGFAHTNVTDNGLKQLFNAPDLTSVVLCDSAVTDSGIAHLSSLRQLQILSLATCNITDVGLSDLSPMPTIRELDLAYTGITNESIPHLAKFKSLERLSVYGTGVTEEGMKRLRRALPNCRIDQ